MGAPLVKQELISIPEYMCSRPVFSGVRVAQYSVFCVVLCRSLFVHLTFVNFDPCFFWLLWCLSFFDLRILIHLFGIFKLFLVFDVVFCRILLGFCPFSFGHCIVCPLVIYCFWLSLFYTIALLFTLFIATGIV